jgi:hypothetical protein
MIHEKKKKQLQDAVDEISASLLANQTTGENSVESIQRTANVDSLLSRMPGFERKLDKINAELDACKTENILSGGMRGFSGLGLPGFRSGGVSVEGMLDVDGRGIDII